jgi:hypothetical protein
MGGQTRGDGALARGGGAVDGDDKRLGQAFLSCFNSRTSLTEGGGAHP